LLLPLNEVGKEECIERGKEKRAASGGYVAAYE